MRHLTKQLKTPPCTTLGLAVATMGVITTLGAIPASANDITAEWATVKPPPVPQLKTVTVDPKATALLVLDFMKVNCGARPRCVATVPNVKKLIDAARAHNMPVFYTLVGRDPTPAGMIDQSLAPNAGDFRVQGSGGADKFIGSNLDQGLKEKGIKTVIITGTSAQGAVAGTANGAAQRGYKAVVPVDGMSAEDAYNEQYAAWHIYKGGPANLVNNATLTRSDLIKFGNP
jgi:nicotinamidase-related amidase